METFLCYCNITNTQMGLLNFHFHQGFTVALTGAMVVELFSRQSAICKTYFLKPFSQTTSGVHVWLLRVAFISSHQEAIAKVKVCLCVCGWCWTSQPSRDPPTDFLEVARCSAELWLDKEKIVIKAATQGRLKFSAGPFSMPHRQRLGGAVEGRGKRDRGMA